MPEHLSRRDTTIRQATEAVTVSAVLAAITVALFAPVYASPWDTIFDPGGMPSQDILLIVWILSWVSHALATDPSNLFNANIFHPVPNMLTGSEHMVGHQPFFAPVYWIAQNPVLAYNASLLAAFVTTGLGLYLLLRHWGVRPAPAFFGAFVYAFSPIRLSAIHALQMLASGFLPMALLFIDRTLLRGRTTDAFGFAFFLCWQTLCSVYVGFFTAIGVALYAVTALLIGFRRLQWRGVLLLAVAGLVSVIIVGAFHKPFLTRTKSGVIRDYRQSRVLRSFSNSPIGSLVTSPARIRSEETGRSHTSYLGIVPFIGMIGCLLRRNREPRWAVAGALSIALIGHIMSLGPTQVLSMTMPYAYLAEWIPGFASMRVPSRFSYLVMLGIAAMAGVGWGRWHALVGGLSKGSTFLILAIAVLFTSYDYGHTILKIRPGKRASTVESIPEPYRALSKLPKGPLLSAPVGENPMHRIRAGILAMYYSTFHWHPLLNGATAYSPPQTRMLEDLGKNLPGADAYQLLCRITGMRYVLLHHARLSEKELHAWNSLGMRKLGNYKNQTLYEAISCPDSDLTDEFLVSEPTQTLRGTPLLPLPRNEAGALIEIKHDTIVRRHRAISFQVLVSNTSPHTWPVLSTDRAHNFSFGSFWQRKTRAAVKSGVSTHFLGDDIVPGQSTVLNIQAIHPRSGSWRLMAGMRQGDTWLTGPTEVPVPESDPPLSAAKTIQQTL